MKGVNAMQTNIPDEKLYSLFTGIWEKILRTPQAKEKCPFRQKPDLPEMAEEPKTQP